MFGAQTIEQCLILVMCVLGKCGCQCRWVLCKNVKTKVGQVNAEGHSMGNAETKAPFMSFAIQGEV